METRNHQKNRGFTLIELMVATTVFISIMLASMGSLFVTLDASKNARALRLAMDNVNYAMESMTRSIRMGKYYYCATAGTNVNLANLNSSNFNNGTDCTLIAFKTQDESATQKVAYELLDGSIAKNSDGNWVSVTAPNVTIENLKFFVKGASSSDNTQASVYIIMKGSVLIKGIPTSFAIQTMASQRNF